MPQIERYSPCWQFECRTCKTMSEPYNSAAERDMAAIEHTCDATVIVHDLGSEAGRQQLDSIAEGIANHLDPADLDLEDDKYNGSVESFIEAVMTVMRGE